MVAIGLGILVIAFASAGKALSRAPAADRHLLKGSPQTVPKVASYTMSARLDDRARTVVGSATIRFKNPSRKPSDHLYFHLYLNAFSGHETLFLRNKASRSGQRHGAPGEIVVHSLFSPAFGKENLWPEDPRSPGDAEDRTDIQVPLPRPLLGFEEIELRLEFTAHLPEIVERTGFERDFFLVAHWFPKLAKRETNGQWAHFPFHPHGEFYADFGDYDVTLEVPPAYVVGSTGKLTRLGATEQGLVRYRAQVQGVHDFAWTAWPGFLQEKREVQGVEVTLLRPPHTPRVAKATWDTLEKGLTHLGAAYGPYPYPTLTVAVPPEWAMRAGGMEYPTFITTGGSELISFLGLKHVQLLTIHELGHQWFQGMLATNEMAYPFLDEGVTSYAESRYLNEVFGDGSLADWHWFTVSRLAGARYVNMRFPGKQAITSSAPQFDSFRSIGSLVYARPTLALETLGRVYGKEKLHAALSLYSERFRFRHPKPRDLLQVLGEVMGKEARIQAQLMFEERGWIDYSLSSLKTRPHGKGFVSSISVERAGDLDLPVTVRVHFSGDSSQDHALPAGRRTHSFIIEHKSPIHFAEVDPEQSILLDENLENNRGTPPEVVPDRDQQFQSSLAILAWVLSWITP